MWHDGWVGNWLVELWRLYTGYYEIVIVGAEG